MNLLAPMNIDPLLIGDMMSILIKTKLDNNIKIRKTEEIVDLPHTVKVNKFNEEAVKTFIEDFSKAADSGQPVVPILIDSYGGHVDSLLAMVDIIKSATVPVATIVNGKAMSCGSVLFSCGANGMRFITPNSRVMIHEVSSWSGGKVEEIKADAAETDRLNKLVFTIMARNIGKPDNYFTDLIHEKNHADWFLSAEECVRHNLANHIKLPIFTVSVDVKMTFE